MSKYCNACGKQVRDDANFCPYCHYQFHNNTQEKPKQNNFLKYELPAIIIIIILLVIGITYISSMKKDYREQLHQVELQKQAEQQEKEFLEQQKLIEEANRKKAEELQAQVYQEDLQRQQNQAEQEKQYEIDKQQTQYENEEERLNSDADNDGLTLREELKLGTNPNNNDSDNDGIIDGDDTNPAGGGRNLNINVRDISIIVHSDYFDYYKNKKRTPYSSNIFGETYVHYNERYIDDIYKQLLNLSKQKDTDIVSEIIYFIHDLNYVYDHTLGFNDYPKYPIETLVEGTGDCEDTSILMASLFKRAGYDVVLLNPTGHIAVGIKCDFDYGYTIYNNKKYCYVESTSKGDWEIGQVPSDYLDKDKNLVVNRVYPIDGGNNEEIEFDDYKTTIVTENLDWDNDEVLNDDDNCPFTDNTNQYDSDGDDVGDACDLCKDYFGIDEINKDKYPEGKYIGCHPCNGLDFSDSCWEKEEYLQFEDEKKIKFDEYLEKLKEQAEQQNIAMCEAEGKIFITGVGCMTSEEFCNYQNGTWTGDACLV